MLARVSHATGQQGRCAHAHLPHPHGDASQHRHGSPLLFSRRIWSSDQCSMLGQASPRSKSSCSSCCSYARSPPSTAHRMPSYGVVRTRVRGCRPLYMLGIGLARFAAGAAPSYGSVRRKCAARRSARACLLTPCERDVLELLARGRNARYVADELGVSFNTVRTHIRHVYEKLGIHTRQDLIDLVEIAQASEGQGRPIQGARGAGLTHAPLASSSLAATRRWNTHRRRPYLTSRECCGRKSGRRHSTRPSCRRPGNSCSKSNRTRRRRRGRGSGCRQGQAPRRGRCDAGRHRC